MTFTFNPTLSSPRDKVRQFIGDTDGSNVQIPDETLDAYLLTETSALKVAYQCALDLAAKYARITEVTIDHQTSRGDNISKSYLTLAAELLSRIRRETPDATQAVPGVWVTGLNEGPSCWLDRRPWG